MIVLMRSLLGAAPGVAVKEKGANVWVAEWEISFDLLQITPGNSYTADMPDTTMSMNIALGDVDRCEPSQSASQSVLFHSD